MIVQSKLKIIQDLRDIKERTEKKVTPGNRKT